MKKQEGKHGWQSACDPSTSTWTHRTFSISFFRWEKKSSGKGLKKSSIGFRIKGSCEKRDALFSHAEGLVKMLDEGWVPDKKSVTLYK